MRPAGLPDAPGGRPVPYPAADPYRNFCRWAFCAALAGLGAWLPLSAQGRALIVCASLLLMTCAALATLGFIPKWRGQPHRGSSPVLWLGALFIAGGAAFDIAATVRHSPDLALEANPFAVALLDSGMPLARVMWLGLAAQAVLVLAGLMLWCNFRIRSSWYLHRLSDLGDGSLSLRLLGLRGGSASALLLGRGTDHPLLVSSLGALTLGVFAYRWYLGLEWFGWVPVSRAWAPLACMALAWLALYGWACHHLTPRDRPADPSTR